MIDISIMNIMCNVVRGEDDVILIVLSRMLYLRLCCNDGIFKVLLGTACHRRILIGFYICCGVGLVAMRLRGICGHDHCCCCWLIVNEDGGRMVR